MSYLTWLTNLLIPERVDEREKGKPEAEERNEGIWESKSFAKQTGTEKFNLKGQM